MASCTQAWRPTSRTVSWWPLEALASAWSTACPTAPLTASCTADRNTQLGALAAMCTHSWLKVSTNPSESPRRQIHGQSQLEMARCSSVQATGCTASWPAALWAYSKRQCGRPARCVTCGPHTCTCWQVKPHSSTPLPYTECCKGHFDPC